MTHDSARPTWSEDVRAALPGWVAGRVLVAVAWGLTIALVEIRLEGVSPITTSQGLFAWDGAYYRDLAELGYEGVEPGGVRFHPLLPLLGWNGPGILAVVSVAALAAGAVVHRLVRAVLDDPDMARRAATLVGIAPPAFSLVWAYAEGLFLVLAGLQLLALHRRRWWWAAAAGALATLARPSGVYLAVPAVIEAAAGLRAGGWRAVPVRALVGRAVAVAAPAAGFAAFLGWSHVALGDALLPWRIQSDLRGGFVLPPVRVVESVGEVFGDPFGDGLHTPFVFLGIALVVVAWRRLPRSWAALATVSLLVNLSADNLNSTERYAYGTIPLLVALAAVTGGRWWRPTVVVSAAGLVALATMAWYGSYVP